jgi:uncharacterized membrane protein
MDQTTHRWTDRKLENVIGNLLRAGVILSAAWVLAGAVLYLYRYGHAFPDYRVFRGEPSDLRYVSGIAADAVARHGRGIIQLGLLILMATPVARVAFSVVAFAVERDWMYVAMTVIVLGLLIFSLSGG